MGLNLTDPAFVTTPTNALWNRAGAYPSLDLCFADTRSLACAITGQQLVTFARSSPGGTFVDSAGTLQTAVTNLALRSEEFDNSSIWTTAGSITRNANADTAPNGTFTADQLIFAAADTTLTQAVTITSGISYAVSIWVKGTAGETIRFTANGIPGGSNVTLTGGWTRYSFVGTSNSTSGSLNISTFAGATARNIYLWGAQLEQASSVGEYIPTTSAINSAPRFDHNPTTGESLGLLVEEARTNLLLRSEELDNASWTKTRASVTANAIAAPTGATTADRLTEDNTATSTHLAQSAGTLTMGTTYTYSIYAKADTRRWLLLSPGGSWGYGWFDVQAGVVGTLVSGGSSATSSIQSVGNGWYRCAITATAVDTRTGIQVLLATGDNVISYNGDNTSGLFLWGAQLEAGAFPTSYIPTTTAAATRAADVASITGSAFSSWYSQSEGTVFARYSFPQSPNTGGARIFVFSNSATTNIIWLRAQGGVNRIYDVTDASVSQAAFNQGAYAAGVEYRAALATKANDFGFAENGGAPQSDSSGTMPSVDRLGIGVDPSGAVPGNVHIRRFTFWPQRFPSSTLQSITQ